MSSWGAAVLCLGAYTAASPVIAYGLYRWLHKNLTRNSRKGENK